MALILTLCLEVLFFFSSSMACQPLDTAHSYDEKHFRSYYLDVIKEGFNPDISDYPIEIVPLAPKENPSLPSCPTLTMVCHPLLLKENFPLSLRISFDMYNDMRALMRACKSSNDWSAFNLEAENWNFNIDTHSQFSGGFAPFFVDKYNPLRRLEFKVRSPEQQNSYENLIQLIEKSFDPEVSSKKVFLTFDNGFRKTRSAYLRYPLIQNDQGRGNLYFPENYHGEITEAIAEIRKSKQWPILNQYFQTTFEFSTTTSSMVYWFKKDDPLYRIYVN